MATLLEIHTDGNVHQLIDEPLRTKRLLARTFTYAMLVGVKIWLAR